MLALLGKKINVDFINRYQIYMKDAYIGESLDQVDNPKNGFSISIDKDGVLISFILFSSRKKDFHEYVEPLPFNLNWQDNINSVTEKLGEPVKNSPMKRNPIVGIIDHYHEYHIDGVKVVTSFSDSGELLALTCTLLSFLGKTTQRV